MMLVLSPVSWFVIMNYELDKRLKFKCLLKTKRKQLTIHQIYTTSSSLSRATSPLEARGPSPLSSSSSSLWRSINCSTPRPKASCSDRQTSRQTFNFLYVQQACKWTSRMTNNLWPERAEEQSKIWRPGRTQTNWLALHLHRLLVI